MSRDRDLLLEVGTEEIPAKFQARALAELPAQVTAKLAAARLAHGDVVVYGTPRRIAVIVRALAERQPDLKERVFGPPASAAFGPDGKPTKAAIGFAQKNGVDAAALQQAEQPGKKGMYVVADRFVPGQPTVELLPALLAELIAGIAWPKSMRWGWGETAFVRPVQWLVALHGTDVLPLTYAGVAAGRTSRGHRFLSKGAIEIKNATAYVDAMRKGFVIVDPAARKDVIRAELLAHREGDPAGGPARRRAARRGHAPRGVPGRHRGRLRPRVPRGPRGGDRHRDAQPPALLRGVRRARQARAALRDGRRHGRQGRRRRAQGQREGARVAARRRAVLLRRGPEEAARRPRGRSSTASCSRPSSATRRRRSATRSAGSSDRRPTCSRICVDTAGDARGRTALQGRPRDRR